MRSKKSAYIVSGNEPSVEVLLVNHHGVTLARLPQRFTSKSEAQAEATRRNEKAKR